MRSAGGDQLAASTLSMRAKAARKRRVNSRHNSNFHAGFVAVDEDRLQRSGIRGRKRYFLYCLVGTLSAVTFLNLAVTAWLLYILGMTHRGLSSVEMISRDGENLMRVLSKASLDSISMDNAMIGARFESNLDLHTEDTELLLQTSTRDKRSSLELSDTKVTLTTGEFCVRPTHSPHSVPTNLVSLARLNAINNLSLEDNITVGQIEEGNKYNDLSIESTMGDTAISGHSGIEVATEKQIHISATADSVSLSAQSTIEMDSERGIYIKFHQLNKIQEGQTFKMCICDNGRVFIVKSKSSCDIRGRKLEKTCGKQNSTQQTVTST